jgi:pimeloyl-ACP methyl ester carboxylesterase
MELDVRISGRLRSALSALSLALGATGALAGPREVQVRYRTVKVDGVGIFYREAGPTDAPTILLLHGFPTSSHMFRDLIPLLAEHYHLIAPDYPGFGYSDAPAPDAFEYSFDHLALVMDRFSQAIGLHRYALYAQDFGGPVGFRLATAHPDRITALIVQNANAYEEGFTPVLRDVVLKAYTDRSDAAVTKLKQLFERPATIRQFVEGAPDPTLVSPDSYEHAQWGMDRPGNKAIQLALHQNYGSNAARYPEWHAYFRSHQPPTLIVWGRGDFVFAPGGAEAYRKDMPSAEVHLLDAGHFALETDSAEIAEYIDEFMTRRRIGR